MAAGPPRANGPVAPWIDIAALFGLELVGIAPTPVLGGWSHSVWRVETTSGVYAIKEMVEVAGGWWIEQLIIATAFELAAWHSGTVAMAEPIPVVDSGELLGRVEVAAPDRRYRCHRWVAGRSCLDLAPDVARSENVGRIVAALAQLDVQSSTTADQLPWNALDAYEETVGEATAKGMEWAESLADLLPHVTLLRGEFADLAGRAVPMTVTHRDVDPKNTLIGADEVALVDWDYAGPRLIAAELLDAAVSFAGGPVDANEACVVATIDAYRRADGPELSFADAAAPIIEEGFRWIMLNAWRCLGHRGVTPEQQDFAGALVRKLAPSWPVSVSATRDWAQRLAHHSR